MSAPRRGLFQVGIGYRGALHDALLGADPALLDFIEVAPENIMSVGGARRERFEAVAQRWPILSHGLSLSVAGQGPLDDANLDSIAAFLGAHGAPWHSDHLAVTGDAARQVHDLLPPLMTTTDARRVGRRARVVGSRLGVPFALENISAYAHRVGDTLAEADYVAEVVSHADGWMLLDVNNLIVNAANGLSLGPTDDMERALDRAVQALNRLPLERVLQIHIAGHAVRADGLRIDTHGEAVSAAAFALLREALARTGPVPVLLERDHGFDGGLTPLLAEVAHIRQIGESVFSGGLSVSKAALPTNVPKEDSPAGDADVHESGLDDLVSAVVAAKRDTAQKLLEPDERLEVYRTLVHGNLYGVIANALPQMVELVGDEAFHALVTRFIAEVGPQNPWFREVPGDFVAWAEAVSLPEAQLLHWEWLELVAMRDPSDIQAWLSERPSGSLSVNPSMQALLGNTELDRLGGHLDSPQVGEPLDAVYLVWRGLDHEPVFQRVDPLTGQALALASAEETSLNSLARVLATHHGLGQAEVRDHLLTQFQALAARDGVILGEQ